MLAAAAIVSTHPRETESGRSSWHELYQLARRDFEPFEPVVPESLGDEKLPACTKPWTSLYILRRGILPCRYGSRPVAEMDDFKAAWNAKEIRKIRHELAEGRFHGYCLRSPACPIVRKDQHAGVLPPGQEAILRSRVCGTLTLRSRLLSGATSGVALVLCVHGGFSH